MAWLWHKRHTFRSRN